MGSLQLAVKEVKKEDRSRRTEVGRAGGKLAIGSPQLAVKAVKKEEGRLRTEVRGQKSESRKGRRKPQREDRGGAKSKEH